MSIINGFRESPSIHYISLLDNKFLSCFARTIISQIVCYNVSSTIGCELLIDTKKRDLQWFYVLYQSSEWGTHRVQHSKSHPRLFFTRKKLKESIPHKKIVSLYKKCQKKFSKQIYNNFCSKGLKAFAVRSKITRLF